MILRAFPYVVYADASNDGTGVVLKAGDVLNE